MIRPIATSLPGMIRDEKMTVSPSLELQLVCAAGDTAERRAGLALTARRDDQHFLLRQPHRLVEADRRREVLQIARRLRDAEDAVERAAGDADLAPGLARDAADRLQPRGIGREGRDQHPPLGLGDLRQQPGMDAFLGAGRLVLEDVGRIAYQREHAAVANGGQYVSTLGASPSTGVSSIFQSPV